MLLSCFIKYLAYERNYSPLTVSCYERDLKAFQQFFENARPGMTWKDVDSEMIRLWLADMLEKGNTAATVNRRLSSLRTLYKYMLAKGETRHDPTGKLRGPKKQKTLPYFVKESEMNRLLDDIPVEDTFEGHRNHTIINTFYNTGIRVSELTSLNTGSVDLAARTIKVTGKRNKQRIVPFGKELCDELRQYIIMRDSVAGDPGPITRETPANPANFYGRSKLEAEEGLQALGDDSFKVAILRCPMIYGPGCKGNFPLLAKVARTLPVFPDYPNKRSVLYAENLAEFVVQAIDRSLSGMFWPQDAEYMSTSQAVRLLGKAQESPVHLTRLLNPFAALALRATEAGRKAFGSLYYNRALSECDFNYRIYGFEEAVQRYVSGLGDAQ